MSNNLPSCKCGGSYELVESIPGDKSNGFVTEKKYACVNCGRRLLKSLRRGEAE